MSERIRAVLFDFNGTVHDMRVIMDQDIHVGRVAFGLDLTPQDVKDCWGTQPDVFYAKLFGRNGSTLAWQEMRDIFNSYNVLFPRRLLPGIRTSLAAFHEIGIVTGIVTSSHEEAVAQALDQAGLAPDAFDFVHAGAPVTEDMAAGQPLLGSVFNAAAMRGIIPRETAFVGDEKITIADAEAVGARPVVVASGTATKAELIEQGVPAAVLINSLLELPQHLGMSQK